MRRTFAIARREFRTMMREKSFILVLIFEILLVSSSAFLSTGYGVMTSPESSDLLKGSRNIISVGLVTDSKREFAQPLQKAGIAYYNYLSLSAAEGDFQSGLLDAIIIGSVDLRKDPSVITVYLPDNTPKIGLIRLSLKRFFLDVEERLRNVKLLVYAPDLKILGTSDFSDSSPAQNFEVFMVFTIPLLFFMPVIMGGSLIIDGLTEELESGRILNLLAAPLSDASIVAGKCIGCLAVTLPHCLIWIIVLAFTPYGILNPLGMFLAYSLYCSLFILLGAAISIWVKRNRPAQMAYTLIAVVAISLMSPSANGSQLLITSSPSYVYTSLALGAGVAEHWMQLLLAALAEAGLAILIMRQARRISAP
ncbi:MAG: ABC transporter permease [Candidatus Altiarchaeota archaeon]